jgi:hypothetical protein
LTSEEKLKRKKKNPFPFVEFEGMRLELDKFCFSSFNLDQTHATWFATTLGAGLSLFGSSFMLSYFFFFSHGKNPLSKLVTWLAFTDYLLALNNLANMIIFYSNPDYYVWGLCVFMRVYFQLVAGANCGYTTCIAFFVWRSLWTRTTRTGKWLWTCFHVFSWVPPLVFVTILLSADLVTRSSSIGLCFPKRPWHIILWFGPIITYFLLNLIFYIFILLRIHHIRTRGGLHSVSRPQTRRLLSVGLRFSFYLLVFFISWSFDILTYIIQQADPECSVFIFTLIYSFCLQAQGALDCVVYGFTNKSFRRRYLASWKRIFLFIFEISISPIIVIPGFFVYLKRRYYDPFSLSSKSGTSQRSTVYPYIYGPVVSNDDDDEEEDEEDEEGDYDDQSDRENTNLVTSNSSRNTRIGRASVSDEISESSGSERNIMEEQEVKRLLGL